MSLLAVLGCSSSEELRRTSTSAAPELPDIGDRDRDHDRLDDDFAAHAEPELDVEVILNRPVTADDLAQFRASGGRVEHVFRTVSYGWSGALPRDRLHGLPAALGTALHFVAAPRAVVPLLDEATRTGRVRPLWAPGFAGIAAGIDGDASTTIGIIDTGFDATHPDLAGRMAGFVDYTSDAASEPRDVRGHGTHVTSIATGSGAAFGIGPGTLRYTSSGDLSGFVAGSYAPAPIHTPNYFGAGTPLSVVSSAVWLGSGNATLRAQHSFDGEAWTPFASTNGPSPQALGSASLSTSRFRYSDALLQNSSESISAFAVIDAVSNYPAVGDGFNVLRGVAPGCRWFGAKVFTDLGLGTSTITGAAIDDLVSRRVALGLKIINMSLGTAGTSDVVLRAKVNSAVERGVLVVAAAGNIGPSNAVSDPGRARAALTVGASNDLNELTSYTSVGFEAPDASEDLKPDLLAPGGSSFRSMILAADSNTTDARTPGFVDLQADDYTSLQGTSMASPFAAGSVALLIDAWQQTGKVWDYDSGTHPRLMKMLLLASSTETNRPREANAGADPTLGRAVEPKDRYEGFGLLNPDAAVEAIAQALPNQLVGTVTVELPARSEWERRAWGRHVELLAGDSLTLQVAPSGTLDVDLYLVSGSPDAAGNPVLLAASSEASPGQSEAIAFQSPREQTAYVFVKRVSGAGNFALVAQHAQVRIPPGSSGTAGLAGAPDADSVAGAAGSSEAGAPQGGVAGSSNAPMTNAGFSGLEEPLLEGGAAGAIPLPAASDVESSGCGCVLAGAGDRTGTWLVVAALFALLRTRRRAD